MTSYKTFTMAAMGIAGLAMAGVAHAGTVDFEDLGVAPGTQLNVTGGASQDSGGFTFTPGPLNSFNDLHFHNQDGFGDNGGTNVGTHEDIVMTQVGGGTFSLLSFDYAGFQTEPSLKITGTLFGGGVLSTFFNPDGNTGTYDTVNLVGWDNLVSVSWEKTSDGSNGFFLDNIVTGMGGAVPEPGTWAMLILGFGLTGAAMRRRERKTLRLSWS